MDGTKDAKGGKRRYSVEVEEGRGGGETGGILAGRRLKMRRENRRPKVEVEVSVGGELKILNERKKEARSRERLKGGKNLVGGRREKLARSFNSNLDWRGHGLF